MKSPIIVVDLDGTLCNSSARDHLALAGQWDEFHSRLGEDEPWPDVVWFLEKLDWADALSSFPIIVGLSGRNARYLNATHAWLKKHNLDGFFDVLLLRPDNNFQSDHELKPALLSYWLESEGHQKEDVKVILEDRDKVVAVWRDQGYNCWQVRPGGY